MAEPAGHQSRRNGLVGRWVVVERRNGRASELVIVTLDEVFATIPPEESASEQASCGTFSHTEFHRRRQRRQQDQDYRGAGGRRRSGRLACRTLRSSNLGCLKWTRPTRSVH